MNAKGYDSGPDCCRLLRIPLVLWYGFAANSPEKARVISMPDCWTSIQLRNGIRGYCEHKYRYFEPRRKLS